MNITILLTLAGILMSCQSVPNNNMPIEDITKDEIVSSIDLEPIQIEVEEYLPNNTTIQDNAPIHDTQTVNTTPYFTTTSEKPLTAIANNPDNANFEGYFTTTPQITSDVNATTSGIVTTRQAVITSEAITTSEAENTLEQDRQILINEINLKSRPAGLLFVVAHEAWVEGNYKRADFLLDRALTISPDEPIIWYQKAEIMYYQGKYRQALNMATRSNSMQPSPEIKKKNLQLIELSKEQIKILQQ